MNKKFASLSLIAIILLFSICIVFVLFTFVLDPNSLNDSSDKSTNKTNNELLTPISKKIDPAFQAILDSEIKGYDNVSAAIVDLSTVTIIAEKNIDKTLKLGSMMYPAGYAYAIENQMITPGTILSDRASQNYPYVNEDNLYMEDVTTRSSLSNGRTLSYLNIGLEEDSKYLEFLKSFDLTQADSSSVELISGKTPVNFLGVVKLYSLIGSQRAGKLISRQTSYIITDFMTTDEYPEYLGQFTDNASRIYSGLKYSSNYLVLLAITDDGAKDNIAKQPLDIIFSKLTNEPIPQPQGLIKSEYCYGAGQIKQPEEDCDSFLEWRITEKTY